MHPAARHMGEGWRQGPVERWRDIDIAHSRRRKAKTRAPGQPSVQLPGRRQHQRPRIHLAGNGGESAGGVDLRAPILHPSRPQPDHERERRSIFSTAVRSCTVAMHEGIVLLFTVQRQGKVVVGALQPLPNSMLLHTRQRESAWSTRQATAGTGPLRRRR